MEQLTKNQAVATSQEAVQNQNEPQLRDENAHNDKSVHGRSEERFSRNAETDLVCRLLLEKKKKNEKEAQTHTNQTTLHVLLQAHYHQRHATLASAQHVATARD